MYINKVFIYGNLTRDPEIRALPSGSQVASFGVATNRNYKNKEGVKVEDVEFHNIVMFGRQAEVAAQYLKKGRPVFIEGRLKTQNWEKDGVKHYRTEIITDSFQFGPSLREGVGAGEAGAPKTASTEQKIEYPDADINPEDIPF